MKFSKKQEKAIQAAVHAAKYDRTVTFQGLIRAEINAPDFEAMQMAAEVLRRCRAWSDECAAEYSRMSADIQAIEAEYRKAGNYDINLWDSCAHLDNVLRDGRTEDSVDFNNALVFAAGSQAGGEADDNGLNLNARLGYVVY